MTEKPPAKKAAPAKKPPAKTAAPAKKAAPAKAAAPASKAGPAKKAAPAKKAVSAPKAASAKKGATAKKAAPAKKAPAVTEQQVRESRFFKKAKTRAERVVRDPEKMRQIAAEASEKSSRGRGGPLDKIWEQLSALIRLVVAYGRGHYREISNQSLVLIVAGLIYFVSPLDLVPDFLPGGFADDYAVLLFVLKRVSEELDAFVEWENGKVPND